MASAFVYLAYYIWLLYKEYGDWSQIQMIDLSTFFFEKKPLMMPDQPKILKFGVILPPSSGWFLVSPNWFCLEPGEQEKLCSWLQNLFVWQNWAKKCCFFYFQAKNRTQAQRRLDFSMSLTDWVKMRQKSRLQKLDTFSKWQMFSIRMILIEEKLNFSN